MLRSSVAIPISSPGDMTSVVAERLKSKVKVLLLAVNRLSVLHGIICRYMTVLRFHILHQTVVRSISAHTLRVRCLPSDLSLCCFCIFLLRRWSRCGL